MVAIIVLLQMQSRHGSYEDVDISKLDLTVSTVGEQRLGLVKSGETSFYIYRYLNTVQQGCII